MNTLALIQPNGLIPMIDHLQPFFERAPHMWLVNFIQELESVAAHVARARGTSSLRPTYERSTLGVILGTWGTIAAETVFVE